MLILALPYPTVSLKLSEPFVGQSSVPAADPSLNAFMGSVGAAAYWEQGSWLSVTRVSGGPAGSLGAGWHLDLFQRHEG